MSMIFSFLREVLIPTVYATATPYEMSEALADVLYMFGTTTEIIAGTLPWILGFLGVLIGLAVAIRYIKRWIGRR